MSKLNDAQLADYKRDGFVVIRGLFAETELAAIRRAIGQDATLGGHQFFMQDTDGGAHPAIAWVQRSETFLGAVPFAERIVCRAEAILAEPCYLWLSKLTIKPAHCAARIEWHQDFAAWRDEGCRVPNMTTCGIAFDRMHEANGALTFLRGSHLRNVVGHEYQGAAQSRIEPAILDNLLRECEMQQCTLDVGDAVFFHANTVHGSAGNTTAASRTLLLASYNAISNAPRDAQLTLRPAAPIVPVSDEELKELAKTSLFSEHDFLTPGGDMMQGFGRAATSHAKR